MISKKLVVLILSKESLFIFFVGALIFRCCENLKKCWTHIALTFDGPPEI